jgi:hypothetical protein
MGAHNTFQTQLTMFPLPIETPKFFLEYRRDVLLFKQNKVKIRTYVAVKFVIVRDRENTGGAKIKVIAI